MLGARIQHDVQMFNILDVSRLDAGGGGGGGGAEWYKFDIKE